MTAEKAMTDTQKQRTEGGLQTRGVFKKTLPGKPLISVITVVYNRAVELEGTLLSVLGLDYGNVEYIIIDGGSTDGTVEMIRRYEDRIDYWISEPDRGIYDAMNKGIGKATGEWINFMNSGDKFASPEALRFFEAREFDADVLFGDALAEYPTFRTMFKTHPMEVMWKHSPFCHQASFARASLMKAFKFDVQYRIGADHDFFYRAYKSNKKFEYVDHVVCLFDAREGATKKYITRAIKDKMDIALKYDFTLSKWLYYRFYMLYIHTVLLGKKVMGKTLTSRITRFLREKK
jgi:glycosyltransferase involved in cell wall biosynthesis